MADDRGLDITQRIASQQLTASMDGVQGPEWLVLRRQPSDPTTPATLFRYLTDPALLAQWSPIVPNRPLTSVGPASSREHPGDPEVAADVVSVITGQEVRHRWNPDVLRWRIIDGGSVVADGCRLKLEMQLERPEFASLYAAGWHVCLGVLDALLAGEKQERIVGNDAMAHGWRELRARYCEQLPGQSDEGL